MVAEVNDDKWGDSVFVPCPLGLLSWDMCICWGLHLARVGLG